MPSGGGGAAAAAGGAAAGGAAAEAAPVEEEKEEEKEESDEDVCSKREMSLTIRWVSDCSIRMTDFVSVCWVSHSNETLPNHD